MPNKNGKKMTTKIKDPMKLGWLKENLTLEKERKATSWW